MASRLRGQAPADVELEEVVVGGGCRYVELGAFHYELIAESMVNFRVLDVGARPATKKASSSSSRG